MNPSVAPTDFGLSRMRTSPPTRLVATTSPLATFVRAVVCMRCLPFREASPGMMVALWAQGPVKDAWRLISRGLCRGSGTAHHPVQHLAEHRFRVVAGVGRPPRHEPVRAHQDGAARSHAVRLVEPAVGVHEVAGGTDAVPAQRYVLGLG